MIYKFHAYGHPNILGTHKKTFEFTKGEDVTLKGNCIIGVNADFKLDELKRFIESSKSGKIKITIKAEIADIGKEEVFAELNKEFKSGHELVFRKTAFSSDRTLGMRSNKASFDFSREFMRYSRKKENRITVIIENKSA